MGEGPSETKIHVDSDWKDEARREKEKLVEQEAAAADAGPLPDPTFMEIVNMVAMQAAVSISGYQHPSGQNTPPDLAMAKHLIDLLEVLHKKTKGNLTEEEDKVLGGVLYEMRMRYVQASGGPSPAEVPTA
ncbi:MAG: DUF1844 domain-containing protein [bacterium]|nr:DUF1844 domain-containing protein [bacterium]